MSAVKCQWLLPCFILWCEIACDFQSLLSFLVVTRACTVIVGWKWTPGTVIHKSHKAKRMGISKHKPVWIKTRNALKFSWCKLDESWHIHAFSGASSRHLSWTLMLRKVLMWGGWVAWSVKWLTLDSGSGYRSWGPMWGPLLSGNASGFSLSLCSFPLK